MTFFLVFIGFITVFSFSWALCTTYENERPVAIYVFMVALALFIYSLMKAGIL